MSEIMMAVLSMPDDMFWADDPVSRYQHNQIRLRAARRIRDLESALNRLLWLHDDDLHGTTPVASETEWDEAWETAAELFKEPPR